MIADAFEIADHVQKQRVLSSICRRHGMIRQLHKIGSQLIFVMVERFFKMFHFRRFACIPRKNQIICFQQSRLCIFRHRQRCFARLSHCHGRGFNQAHIQKGTLFNGLRIGNQNIGESNQLTAQRKQYCRHQRFTARMQAGNRKRVHDVIENLPT